jgi:hypothetical protein
MIHHQHILNIISNFKKLRSTIYIYFHIPTYTMNSIIKFNKHVIDFQSGIVQEFADKLKLILPEEFHSAIDEQINKDNELFKVSMKNNNKTKNKSKKLSKHSAWKLFAAHKSKEFTDVTQAEKWSMCSPLWAELKKTGEDKYWQDMADKLNSELNTTEDAVKSDCDAVKSDSDADADKKTKGKTKAPKKPASKKKPVPDDNHQDEQPVAEEYIQMNVE